MSAPALTVFANGPTAVSGDQLNTFMQTCNTASDMRAFIGISGISVAARGINAVNDGLQGTFYWNATATGPDDNLNTIVPTGAKIGAWVRFSSGISAPMIPVVNASSTTLALEELMAGGIVTSSPDVSHSPTGNPPTTLGVLVLQGVTSATVERQFMLSVNLTSSSGVGSTTADKVAIYAANSGNSGASNIWSINSLTTMLAGFPTTSEAVGYECDFNNFAATRGATDGLAGLAIPTAYGLLVTGASTYGSSAGIAVEGNTSGQWYRGFCAASGVVQCAFADYTYATTGLEMQATHTGWGIDMNLSALGGAMRMPNNGGLFTRNAANSADVCVAIVDTINNLEIGCTAAGGNTALGIYMGAGTVPFTDNAFSCGYTTHRWTSIYATNGTIQTSMAELKTDIQPLPDVLPLLKAINPVTYRWKSGGFDMRDVEEMQTVHETQSIEHEHFEIETHATHAVKVPKKIAYEKEIYDEVPLLDPSGNQIVAHIPPVLAAFNEKGEVIREAEPARTIPQTHRVPRLVSKKVTTRKPVEREGRRTHWGFLAGDVKSAFDGLGMDFGGYIKGEDGIEGLRPDQLVPVLWAISQRLLTRIEALEAAGSAARP